MVLRCAWGTCNVDERYPERLKNGVKLILFPKPKTNLEKCLRWIKACGRPHDQLNVQRINKHKAVCSKHFVGGDGPTEQFPDPIPADGSVLRPTRPPLKRTSSENQTVSTKKRILSKVDGEGSVNTIPTEDEAPNKKNNGSNIAVQTEEPWVSGMDMFAMATKLHVLKEKEKQYKETISKLETEIKELKDQQKSENQKPTFGVDEVLRRQEKLKNVFKYYTGITYIRFAGLLAFLVPAGSSINYEKGRKDIRKLSMQDGLFLTLCRLRHNFGLKDLSVRFKLSLQSSGIVFNTWISHMYFKLGQLCIWPHRDIIINNMPKDFKHDYPTTLIIIEETEFRTQAPCALGLQSQLYSDYKSSTTLKALIGCDPNGSVIFASELFTGCISDKQICEQSGFYDVLETLQSKGYVKEGDAIMADKGFTIKEELSKLNLLLNIPPMASSTSQMSVSDTILTEKIAKHRVHIERLIAKVKTYKILSVRIPTSLFKNINKIWSVCCHLTLFHDVFVTDSKHSK
ncbi:uncharacterized protein LOC134279217 [Saccostrea cucullata]|uniref:uncharacterized protein LOC134245934 n=1 Tax=Saccostrea cuccullata TaxID=36930 RepID=UPI002ED1F3E6